MLYLLTPYLILNLYFLNSVIGNLINVLILVELKKNQKN
jgi:hypothetical protein